MFLAKTSHELRTPLNAIIGFSSLFSQPELSGNSEKQSEYGRLIRSSGEHLLALIDDLLQMSKIEAGRVELRDEMLSLSGAFEDALALIEIQAQAKSIQLRRDLPRDEIVLEADAKALRQILLNLLSNAVKFTPVGGTVGVTAVVNGNGELAIRVSDTGVGIPADALERVFQPFERAVRDTTRNIEGTGLGLSITSGLVKLHGGTVALASTVGKGTVVTIILPANRVVRAGAASREMAVLSPVR
jgi:signal transduction histidine kinase